MGTSDLPNMYPEARGLHAQGLRKYITMNVTFYLWSVSISVFIESLLGLFVGCDKQQLLLHCTGIYIYYDCGFWYSTVNACMITTYIPQWPQAFLYIY